MERAAHYLWPMSSDLYSNRVLELAADIPHVGALDAPDGKSRRVSRLCGSIVEVGVRLDGDLICDFAIEPKACALGQASSSVLARNIIGATIEDVRNAREQFSAMLKQGGAPPSGRFWELRHLAGVADYPPRHTSTLLAFDAALEAIDRAVATRNEGVQQSHDENQVQIDSKAVIEAL
jgi:NifU-like protein involved in Fe-S cluster formation